MDQALYDQLTEAKKAGVLQGQDLADFNTLDAAGEFKAFQGAPAATPPNVVPAPQAETPPSTALPKIGDTIDSFKDRPPVDLSPDQQLPFSQEFANRTGMAPESTANEPYPAAHELGRMLALGSSAIPALGGTGLHEMTGSREIGNIGQGALSALEAMLVARTLGIHPIQRMIGPIQSAIRLLGRPQAPGGTPGIPPPPPGTPAGGGTPGGAGSAPGATNFTSYAPSQQPRVINLTRTRPPGSTLH